MSLEVYLVTKVMFISKNVFIGKIDLDLSPLVSSRINFFGAFVCACVCNARYAYIT